MWEELTILGKIGAILMISGCSIALVVIFITAFIPKEKYNNKE